MKWTPEQLSVIDHKTGHAKVSAVAGSGKTATLVERIARLLESGFKSSRTQVVMFNTSARDEFELRLTNRLRDIPGKTPSVNTFHSVAMGICSQLEKMGKLPVYQLESRPWMGSKLAGAAIESVTDSKPSGEAVEAFLNFISIVKSDIISAADKLPEVAEIAGKEPPDYFIDAFDCFESMRHKARIRFFSDLIRDPVLLLLEDAALAEQVCPRLDHLLVDEFQDADDVQSALITILAGSTASVMVVGDVDQCIYEWRGANPMILESLFDADFPDCTTFTLSYTFRYGHAVSILANHVKRHNRHRNKALCLSHESTPSTAVTMKLESPSGCEIVEVVQKWISEGRKLNEIAVLVKMYALSAPAEIGFLNAGIPYRLDGKEVITDRPEFQMVAGYLRAASGDFYRHAADGTRPTEFLQAMLSVPPLPLTSEQNKTLSGAIAGTDIDPEVVAARVTQNLQLNEWAKGKVLGRVKLIQEAISVGTSVDATRFLRELFEKVDLHRTIERLAVQKDTGKDKTTLLDALLMQVEGESICVAASHFDRLMAVAGKHKQDQSSAPGADAVTITSIHKAKGLEWPLVILPGLRDGVFPSSRSESEQRLEADRRLMYVAITRAKESLVMIHPHDTDLDEYDCAGVGTVPDDSSSVASRFLYEGNVRLSIDTAASISGAGGKVRAADLSLVREYTQAVSADVEFEVATFSPAKGRLVCGPNTPFKAKVSMRVSHKQHGSGVIEEIFTRAGTHSMVVKMDSGKQRIFVAHNTELREVG